MKRISSSHGLCWVFGRFFVLLIGWGFRGVGWTRRFTTLPMKSAAIMRRIRGRGLVPGFFLFEWLAVYWWKRAEVPDATVLSAFP